MINIYVGNLPYRTSEADLAELFGKFGPVDRASIVMDRQTGRSRGFGFVEMPDAEAGRKAIEELAGADYEGRQLTINEARPRGGGSSDGASGGGSGGGYTPRYTPAPTSFGESNGYANRVAGHKRRDPMADPLDGDAELPPGEVPTGGYRNSRRG